MSQEEILTQARNIKEYCINHTTNEEQCPFFNGYKTEGMLQIVICELNKLTTTFFLSVRQFFFLLLFSYSIL